MIKYKDYTIMFCADGTYEILDDCFDLVDGEFESVKECKEYIDNDCETPNE